MNFIKVAFLSSTLVSSLFSLSCGANRRSNEYRDSGQGGNTSVFIKDGVESEKSESQPKDRLESSVYNVKDFGANGFDNEDDTKAFQSCVDAALKTKVDVKILVPFGKYYLNDEILFDYITDISVEVVGVSNNEELPELYSISKKNIILARGFLAKPSVGAFKISNLKLVSNNEPYSPNHSKINKDAWNAGIGIIDKKSASVKNVIVQNFYGQGIYVSTTQQEGIALSSRFKNVEIVDSKVLNVWGFNPKRDNYGDGIYVSDFESASILNNYVYNDVSVTKQFGRAGIVIEFMAQNAKLLKNIVYGGYDRAVHIEATFGGHLIQNNKFYGTDLSMILAESIPVGYKEVNIVDNTFSNRNFKKDIKVTKSFASNSFGDRALALLISNSKMQDELIRLTNNLFLIDQKYAYDSNSILNNRSNNVYLKGNMFQLVNGDGKFGIYNYANVNLMDNKLGVGIQLINK